MNHKKTYYENGNIKEMIMDDCLGIDGLSHRVTYRENNAGKIWIECFTLMEKRHGEYKRYLLDGTLIGHHFLVMVFQ